MSIYVTICIILLVILIFNVWGVGSWIRKKGAPVRVVLDRWGAKRCKKFGHSPDYDTVYVAVRLMRDRKAQDDSVKLCCKWCGKRLDEYYIHTKQRR